MRLMHPIYPALSGTSGPCILLGWCPNAFRSQAGFCSPLKVATGKDPVTHRVEKGICLITVKTVHLLTLHLLYLFRSGPWTNRSTVIKSQWCLKLISEEFSGWQNGRMIPKMTGQEASEMGTNPQTIARLLPIQGSLLHMRTVCV